MTGDFCPLIKGPCKNDCRFCYINDNKDDTCSFFMIEYYLDQINNSLQEIVQELRGISK